MRLRGQRLCSRSGGAGARIAVASTQNQIGFAVHLRRWVVERFFAWINRNRRLAKDFEASIASADAFPLCGFGNAPHPPIGESIMSFESDASAQTQSDGAQRASWIASNSAACPAHARDRLNLLTVSLH